MRLADAVADKVEFDNVEKRLRKLLENAPPNSDSRFVLERLLSLKHKWSRAYSDGEAFARGLDLALPDCGEKAVQ